MIVLQIKFPGKPEEVYKQICNSFNDLFDLRILRTLLSRQDYKMKLAVVSKVGGINKDYRTFSKVDQWLCNDQLKKILEQLTLRSRPEYHSLKPIIQGLKERAASDPRIMLHVLGHLKSITSVSSLHMVL